LSGAALLAASCCHGALHAQQLPTTLDFGVRGAFKNPVAEGVNSALVIENNLSGGYSSAFDLTDAPAALNPAGPIGSAAFQWGNAATWTDYPHPSALWFEPLAAFSIARRVSPHIAQTPQVIDRSIRRSTPSCRKNSIIRLTRPIDSY
jgi:hypothetical protein